MPISSDQPSHMPRPQQGPLTSSHRICLDRGECSRYVLTSRRFCLTTVQTHWRGMTRSVNWENGDELPSCFLERGRLGCALPCSIHLRAQRSDHMAVA